MTDNKHFTSSFGLAILGALQRKPVIYSGHIFDPDAKAKRLQQKASRKANRR